MCQLFRDPPEKSRQNPYNAESYPCAEKIYSDKAKLFNEVIELLPYVTASE